MGDNSAESVLSIMGFIVGTEILSGMICILHNEVRFKGVLGLKTD